MTARVLARGIVVISDEPAGSLPLNVGEGLAALDVT